MRLNSIELDFWNDYLLTLDEKPINPVIIADISGNKKNCDILLNLYLDGKKTAGCSLKKEYTFRGERLPAIGDYWIILDSRKIPKCIVKTIAIETYIFKDVPMKLVLAEGEGDLSMEYWKTGHREFFSHYQADFGITDVENEEILAEFFEVVYKV